MLAAGFVEATRSTAYFPSRIELGRCLRAALREFSRTLDYYEDKAREIIHD
jgi:hypothetical protein